MSADVEHLRGWQHFGRPVSGGNVCGWCGETWPCPPERLRVTCDELRAENAALAGRAERLEIVADAAREFMEIRRDMLVVLSNPDGARGYSLDLVNEAAQIGLEKLEQALSAAPPRAAGEGE